MQSVNMYIVWLKLCEGQKGHLKSFDTSFYGWLYLCINVSISIITEN